MFAQREMIAQPRVEILHQGTRSRRLFHRTLDRFMELKELPTQPLMQIDPAPPVCVGGRLFPEKVHHLPDEKQRDLELLGNLSQLVIKHLGKGQQIIPLILQCFA